MKPFLLLRIATGCLLLTAAVLKTVSLVDRPMLGGFWFETRSTVSLAIFLECLLASWMFVGSAPWWLRRVGAACFAAFFLVAVSKWTVGAESCGCFGDVQVPPWITAGLDLAFFAGFLLISSPTTETESLAADAAIPVPSRFRDWGVACCLSCGMFVGLGLGVAALTSAPEALAAESAEGGVPDTGLIVLDPEEWVGQAFPLFKLIDGSSDLKTGNWWVAIYSHTCGHCRDMLPVLEAAAAAGMPIAALSVPPHASAANDPLQPQGPVWSLRLSEDRDWFAATPLLMHLQEGLVVETVDREAVDVRIAAWAHPLQN